MFPGLLDTALYLSCSWGYVLSTICLSVAVHFNFCNVFIGWSPENMQVSFWNFF